MKATLESGKAPKTEFIRRRVFENVNNQIITSLTHLRDAGVMSAIVSPATPVHDPSGMIISLLRRTRCGDILSCSSQKMLVGRELLN